MMEAEGAGTRATLGAVPERRALNFHTPGPSARPEAAPLLQRGHAPHEGWDEELYKTSKRYTRSRGGCEHTMYRTVEQKKGFM